MTTDLSALHALIERAERDKDAWLELRVGKRASVRMWQGMERGAWVTRETLEKACRAVLDALDGGVGA